MPEPATGLFTPGSDSSLRGGCSTWGTLHSGPCFWSVNFRRLQARCSFPPAQPFGQRQMAFEWSAGARHVVSSAPGLGGWSSASCLFSVPSSAPLSGSAHMRSLVFAARGTTRRLVHPLWSLVLVVACCFVGALPVGKPSSLSLRPPLLVGIGQSSWSSGVEVETVALV